MGYLSNFEYDVFLSYAHKDNETTSSDEEGWMTMFYKQLQLTLAHYLDGTNVSNIWCDHELRKNIKFDGEIKKVIENSAIFMAFSSNNFYRSEYCCTKELSFFYEFAKAGSIGLNVDNASRIFQVQLLRKHHDEWLDEFKGSSAYEMFRLSSNPPDPDDQGITLFPEMKDKAYKERMIEIVQDVCKTLKKMSKVQAPATAPQKSKQVFLGKVSYRQSPLRQQIIQELKNINVDICMFDEPCSRSDYEAKVKEEISKSDLLIHLFDDIAGEKIDNDYPYTFSQEQLLIGKKEGKEQLIFIPNEMEFDKLSDRQHAEFLSGLSKNKNANDHYNLVKENSVRMIVDHIKNRLKNAAADNQPDCANSIWVDYNEVDFDDAVKLYSDLSGKDKVYLTRPGNGPTEFINSHTKGLETVKTVIIVCAKVVKEWILERISEIICAIKTGKSSISKLQVYKDGKITVDMDLACLS